MLIRTYYNTGCFRFHNKCAKDSVILYLGKNNQGISKSGICNPHFLPVDGIILTIFRRPGVSFTRVCITAGSGLCQAVSTEQFSGCKSCNIALSLIFIAVIHYRKSSNTAMSHICYGKRISCTSCLCH